MYKIKINYIKFSFITSIPCKDFINNNFVKKTSIFVGKININDLYYKCLLMLC